MWRFIVPALLAAGVPKDAITILRRRDDGEVNSVLSGIKIVTKLNSLGKETVDLTMNCAVAKALVSVQEKLVAQFPRARHFCDTPIFSGRNELRRTLRLSVRRLHSLEDWPLMPNLAYFIGQMRRDPGMTALQIENFGILTHFLSLYRSIHGGWSPLGRRLYRDPTVIIGTLSGSRDVVFRYSKDLPISKVRFRSSDALVEDFHEVESQPHRNSEVLYRVVANSSVAYYCGAEVLTKISAPSKWLAFFEPLSERKNVHELDKFLGLLLLFRKLLSGAACRPYSYLDSVRDSITALNLKDRDRYLLI